MIEVASDAGREPSNNGFLTKMDGDRGTDGVVYAGFA